jgi:CheY-like chemotaxis protein
MAGDLVSVRMVCLSAPGKSLDVLRQGAMLASVPIEFAQADGAKDARDLIERGDVDLVALDGASPPADQAAVITLARSQPNPPFLIILADPGRAVAVGADAMAFKPSSAAEGARLLNGWVRVRLPNRVLVIDDSRTTRTIVRKILEASRIPIVVEEVDKGEPALQQVRGGGIDIAFLDYNDLEPQSAEALGALKRAHPKLVVVVMTASSDKGVAAHAVDCGASSVLVKPFYPADVDRVFLEQFGLTPLRASRA